MINNNFSGKWETFYENGKPELQFEVTEDGVAHKCLAWEHKGKQTVIDGKGE